MAKQAVAARTDLDPIDRLEEKVKLLVGLVERLRANEERLRGNEGRLSDENARLVRELDTTLARLTSTRASRGRSMGSRRG